jgi:hypothetical protein
VEAEAGALPARGGGGDFDFSLSTRLDERPMGSRRPVAQHGAVADSQHSGQEPPLPGYLGVADGVHAPMNDMQSARSQPPGDGAVAHPEQPQLPDRHHAVLPRRQLGEPAVGGCLTLSIIIGGKVKHPPSVTAYP